MSHIHIPDGFLPTTLCVLGYIITFTILLFLIKRINGDDVRRKVPLVGVMAAVMLISMSIPLGFLPLHISLAVLCGIILGPNLGFLTIFVVISILALIGHGGITVVGLNTLVMGSEVIIGAYLFKLLSTKLGLILRVAVATVIALMVSMSLMFGIVGSTVGLAEALPHQEYVQEHHDDSGKNIEVITYNKFTKTLDEIKYLSFTGWSALAVILLLGIMVETLVTVLIVRYFTKVRPDIISYYQQT